MIFPFHCTKCESYKEVVRPSIEHRAPENCEKCNIPMTRVWTGFHFSGSKNEFAEFCPAFGKILKNKYERKEEARKTGAIEIGNEKPETVHKYFDQQRKEKRENNWKKALDEVV